MIKIYDSHSTDDVRQSTRYKFDMMYVIFSTLGCSVQLLQYVLLRFVFLLLCSLVFSLIHIFHILLQYCQLKNLMYAANNAFYHFKALNGFSSQSK